MTLGPRVSPSRRQFASDNHAGATPEVMAALRAANHGHAVAYGGGEGQDEEAHTTAAIASVRAVLGRAWQVHFVLTGTAGNALALAALCHGYQGIIAHQLAHLRTSECGAQGFFTHGAGLCEAAGAHGRIDVSEVDRWCGLRQGVHRQRPRVLSLTQVSEVGTVYTLAHLRALAHAARRHGLAVHMDGARFANAVASLGVAPGAILAAAGVDVLTFGGSKNGGMMGEILAYRDASLGEAIAARTKQSGQLLSKMRFISAPWVGMLADGRWLMRAAHANRMASRLASGIARLGTLEIIHPCEANAVFVRFEPSLVAALHGRGWRFHQLGGGSRLMCAWDTRPADVDHLLEDLATVRRPRRAGAVRTRPR